MTRGRWRDLLELIGGIAIVASLIFVAFELKQSREIAFAEQTRDLRTSAREVSLTEIGEELPTALAKACEEPEKLASSELMALNGYYVAITYSTIRAYREDSYEISGVLHWRDYAHAMIPPILSMPPGRAWWKMSRSWIPEEIHDLGLELLDTSSQSCVLDSWRELIKDEV